MDTPEVRRQYQAEASSTPRDRLVEEHLDLVKRVAGRLALVVPSTVSTADLEGYGVLGLLQAAERFDPSRGVPFAAYANTRIRGAILDGLRTMDPVPSAWRQQARLLEEAGTRLAERLGRSADDSELASELGISTEELAEWEQRAASRSLVYLDQIRKGRDGDEPGSQPLDLLTQEDESLDPDGALMLQERQEALAKAIEGLAEQERLVVSLIYYEGLTARETAQVLALSPSRISQIHSRAILRLRSRLRRYRDRVL